MATASTAGEVMRVVLPPLLKVQFRERCTQQGQNMSERMRQLIAQDVSSEATPAQRLSQILASTQAKNEASALPALSIDDIDAFIDEIREERIAKAHVA
ncbi:hypothetical protein VJ918_05360 [Adlercreutzia sp. R21]|uniref:Arc family DNA-binding protein n=1 Tax=Adlercreutzia wanghongyangiae TaxID=3111451 RepID=A0ABU6IF55_9ACTN|nr:hypothetical protein [Adlercreutzia sp. R21]MEC4175079.1 hypothetical protein [Adlercreutzia sp. R7]MEC4184234.1 hypothetical protein [Adlercreutzia sp. R21]